MRVDFDWRRCRFESPWVSLFAMMSASTCVFAGIWLCSINWFFGVRLIAKLIIAITGLVGFLDRYGLRAKELRAAAS